MKRVAPIFPVRLMGEANIYGNQLSPRGAYFWFFSVNSVFSVAN